MNNQFSVRYLAHALLLIVLLIAGLLPLSQTHTVRADSVIFTISGSTQMYTLGQLMSARYMDNNATVNIGVDPSSSQFAFDTACQGSTQIGMSDVYIQDNQLRQTGCADMTGIPVA